ncbi:endonuclease/exonuclease/phosphatase family protein [Streptomyces sp. RFCAC02]|uniref:endonuclease/exonuclease/phosphatase family protein n=1 Tax=Streptomyces sp. RFCAC02 TaxID=2499143 RepID=UPI00102298D6|nr:endonuclease/exonuclease/phosphatase family protein [Streptomyces sp. RFCAC02]
MRVLTWNLWWRFGPWERRREAILGWLRRERPDVCGLQEVWAADGTDFAALLADELGLHRAFAPMGMPSAWRARAPGVALRAGVGVAVLSRWPITETAVRRLPSGGPRNETRVALFARIAAGRRTVPFFTTHLHSTAGATEVRCAQAAALADFVRERGTGVPDGVPPVVTGDFNAPPDAEEVRLFRAGAGVEDVWRCAPAGRPDATRRPGHNAYRPPGAGSPDESRIDHVLVGAPGTGRVRDVWRTGDRPLGGVWPSDHAAIVADLDD